MINNNNHKIKTTNLLLFLSFFLMALSSCKKSEWFDVKSDLNLTVPSSLQDFEYLLDHYTLMNQYTPGLGEVGSDGHFMPDNQWLTSINDVERNAYTWTNKLPNLLVGDWNESYKKIFRCNLVLDGLAKINPKNSSETAQFNRVKGNALFHRAKNYYELAQIYAQPYKKVTASIDLSIPLKEGIDITEPSKRSSVQQTYDQIISDLIMAYSLLPDVPQVLSRGSKTACFALLARTFLTMEDYPKAGMYADSCLKRNATLINFNSVGITNTNMGEFNVETIFHSERITSWFSTWLPGYVFVDPALYALYDNNDLRKTRFFTLMGTDIVFKGNYTNTTVGFSGLATDEQYLIRAECLAREDNINEALKYLNDLIRTRWNNLVPYQPITASTSDEALTKILIERKKELLLRGTRWTDLRRLNLDSRFKISLTRTIGGQTYILEPDSYKYTLPIPNDVLALSTMQQNPGW